MYTAHTSALPFKDNRLRFYLSPYFQPISLQLEAGPEPHPEEADGFDNPAEGPWKEDAPLQAPNCKPSLLSKLTLSTATFSYLSIATFTAIMFRRWDTKTVMSSAYAEIFARTLPVSVIPRRAGQIFSSLSLRSRGSKART